VLGLGETQICAAVSHLESPSPIPGPLAKMEFSRQAQLQTVRSLALLCAVLCR